MYMLMSSGPFTLMNASAHSVATALASSVLPVRSKGSGLRVGALPVSGGPWRRPHVRVRVLVCVYARARACVYVCMCDVSLCVCVYVYVPVPGGP
jgi:hypothetical protein